MSKNQTRQDENQMLTDEITQCAPRAAISVESRSGASLDPQLQERLAGKTLLAVVLDGVSPKWQMNVLQVLATSTSVQTTVDGYGTVDPVAFRISPDQARHLATQITELLGRERVL